MCITLSSISRVREVPIHLLVCVCVHVCVCMYVYIFGCTGLSCNTWDLVP